MTSRSRNERGVVIVLLSFSLLILLLLAGFAVDLGSWYLSASRLQRSADAAALAGADLLPDQSAAEASASESLQRNGVTDGLNNTSVSFDVTDGFSVSITNSAVSAHFLKPFMNSISITRVSRATRTSSKPSIGSPYNVLGTGDLNMSGLPEKQNFWLAVNGECAPKEDGDLFSARYDGNKVGVDPVTGAATTSSAHHVCLGPELNSVEKNPSYTGAGYSYFVDIPTPPANGSVTLRVYDMSWYAWEGDDIDMLLKLPGDLDAWVDTRYIVWNVNGTPDDLSDDTIVRSLISAGDDDQRPGALLGWYDLVTLPYESIKDGGVYRIQVYTQNDETDISLRDPDSPYWGHKTYYGDDWNYMLGGAYVVNAFSLWADPSWGATDVCDSRKDDQCPRVYARSAMSVLNRFAGTGGTATGKSDAYFGRIPASLAGSTVRVYLWDPGEGVSKIEFIAPDGSPLAFDWSASPNPGGYSGTNVTSIDTSGTGPQPGPNRSSNKKFNDRMLSLNVHVPSNYASMVASKDDDYVKIRYTLSNSPNDRTTWGFGLPEGSNGTPRLNRVIK